MSNEWLEAFVILIVLVPASLFLFVDSIKIWLFRLITKPRGETVK